MTRRDLPTDAINDQFGFRWGEVEVRRECCEDRFGWLLRIRSTRTKRSIHVRVSPSGRKVEVVA